jgi:hypothetical protein
LIGRYLAFVFDYFAGAAEQFFQRAAHLHHQVREHFGLGVVEAAEGMSEQTGLFAHLEVQHLIRLLFGFEEVVENFIGVVAEPVAPGQLALRKQTLFQGLVAVLVEKGAFDRVTQHLEGLSQGSEVVSGDQRAVGGGFGVVAEGQFLVLVCDLLGSGVGGELERLVVVAYHVTSLT